MARLAKLPGWVVSNEESVEREVAPYRSLTPAQRLELGATASRSALAVALALSDRDRVLSYRDPIPHSTKLALARLRAEYSATRR